MLAKCLLIVSEKDFNLNKQDEEEKGTEARTVAQFVFCWVAVPWGGWCSCASNWEGAGSRKGDGEHNHQCAAFSLDEAGKCLGVLGKHLGTKGGIPFQGDSHYGSALGDSFRMILFQPGASVGYHCQEGMFSPTSLRRRTLWETKTRPVTLSTWGSQPGSHFSCTGTGTPFIGQQFQIHCSKRQRFTPS